MRTSRMLGPWETAHCLQMAAAAAAGVLYLTAAQARAEAGVEGTAGMERAEAGVEGTAGMGTACDTGGRKRREYPVENLQM